MDALDPPWSPPHTLAVTFGRILASLLRLLPTYSGEEKTHVVLIDALVEFHFH